MIYLRCVAVCLAIVVCSGICGKTSNAAITFSVTQVDNSTGGAPLNGFVTNDVKITFNGQYTGSQARIELAGAATPIYQDAVGSAVAPNPAFIGVFPSLAFDTFVGQGSAFSNGPYGLPSVGGGAVDLGGAAMATFNSTLINQAWNPPGGTTIVDQTNFLIGRFTFARTAHGLFQFLASAGGTPMTIKGLVTDGVISTTSGPLVIVGNLSLTQTVPGEVVAGTVPLTNITTLAFDNVNAPVYTSFIVPPKPRILHYLPTLNDAGEFAWNTSGALPGTYVWSLTGVTGAYSDIGTVTVIVGIPEPGTLALFGLGITGVVGVARRRG